MKIETLQVMPLGTNCYLLYDEATGKCAVIDPGGEPERILGKVEELGCSLCCILLTHGHYDHTSGVAGIQARFPDIPVYLNAADRYEGATDPRTKMLYPVLSGNVQDLNEGDTVRVGDLTVSVLSTPGHSKGSVTLLCGSTMFSGDTLFAGSCGRSDLTGGDTFAILSSLARLGRLEGNYTVLPGHMDPSDLDTERQHNPYLRQALRG